MKLGKSQYYYKIEYFGQTVQKVKPGCNIQSLQIEEIIQELSCFKSMIDLQIMKTPNAQFQEITNVGEKNPRLKSPDVTP